MVELLNCDCMEYMATCKDKQFDLAIVDPPYGIGGDSLHSHRSLKSAGKLKNRVINKMNTIWDDLPPNDEYFTELERVSKNWIIWGGNYFDLGRIRCFVAWDKCQPWDNFSQVELAYTSFDMPSKLYRFDNRTADKIHPTQKPVQIYKFLLRDFAVNDFKIIDTHLGSGSSAIAAYDFGCDFVGREIDKDYYDAAVKRFEIHKMQQKLF